MTHSGSVVSGRWVLRNSLLLGSNYLIEHLSLEPFDLMHWSQILPLVIYQAGCVVFARANLTYRGFYQQVQLQSSTGEKCKYKLRGRKRWNWRRRNGDTHRVNIEQSASGRCEADICNWKLLNHTKKSERWRPFTVCQKCFSPLIDRASVGRKSEQFEKSGGWSWQLRLGGIKLAFHWSQFCLFGLIDWDSNLTEVWQEDLKRYGTWRPKNKVRHHLI